MRAAGDRGRQAGAGSRADHDAAGDRPSSRQRSRPPQLHGRATQRVVGGRHHLPADAGRISSTLRSFSTPGRAGIVGWAFSADLKTRVVLDALDMALMARKRNNVVHHSDRGSQGRSQAVVATRSLLADRELAGRPAGVFQSSVFRGRELRAVQHKIVGASMPRSVPGKYWRGINSSSPVAGCRLQTQRLFFDLEVWLVLFQFLIQVADQRAAFSTAGDRRQQRAPAACCTWPGGRQLVLHGRVFVLRPPYAAGTGSQSSASALDGDQTSSTAEQVSLPAARHARDRSPRRTVDVDHGLRER